ncbi:MAG: hypothetical protein ABTQ34_02640 [Bdellovibrionales bacterium]
MSRFYRVRRKFGRAQFYAFLLAICSLLLFASPVKAEAAAVSRPVARAVSGANEPDPRSNPVLAEIMGYGARIFYMGRLSGTDSWLIYKNNQIQFAYTFSDSQNALVGVMFGPNGDGITSKQMNNLVNSNPEVSALIKAAAAAHTSRDDSAALANQASAAILGGTDSSAPIGKLPLAPLDPTSAPAASLVSNSAVPAPVKSALSSSGERLLADLNKAAGVDLGQDSAPQITMIMSPNCSHCKAAWRSLREFVKAGKLRVRLIPVGAIPEDEAVGALLLHMADPMTAWDKYVGNALGGDKAQLSGTPDESSKKAVRDNYVLADSWGVRDTPYFVYRGKSGKVKVVRGEPEKVSALLDDVVSP